MVTTPAGSISILAAATFSSISFARFLASLNRFGVSPPLPLNCCKVLSLIRQFGKPPALPVRLEKAMPFLR
jgi:hypothetical protein